MADYILDTDTLTLFSWRHPVVTRRVFAHAADMVALSAWTVEEQIDGWRAAANAARTPARRVWASELLVGLTATWAAFPVLPDTAGSLSTFDRLVKLRLNVGRFDLRIAATAFDAGATVVTRNRVDYGRVPGLNVVDWSV